MTRTSAAADRLVSAILTRLTDKFHPSRIWLFGSRARGNARPDSDYDFLIEINKLPEGISIRCQQMTWLEDFPEIEVQVHWRLPGALERRQNDPGRIDWDVAREGKLLYSVVGEPEEPVAAGTFKSYPPAKMPESLHGWFKHAEKTRRVAVHLSSGHAEWKNEICFYSQLCAENYLRSLIISRHQRPARTQNLSALLAHLGMIGLALDDLDEDCRFLTQFAATIRTPNEGERERDDETQATSWIGPPMIATETESRRALAGAERIAAAVKSHLPNLGACAASAGTRRHA